MMSTTRECEEDECHSERERDEAAGARLCLCLCLRVCVLRRSELSAEVSRGEGRGDDKSRGDLRLGSEVSDWK